MEYTPAADLHSTLYRPHTRIPVYLIHYPLIHTLSIQLGVSPAILP
jgi:hypothetical protein